MFRGAWEAGADEGPLYSTKPGKAAVFRELLLLPEMHGRLSAEKYIISDRTANGSQIDFSPFGGKIYYFSAKDYHRFSSGRYWIGGSTYYFNSKGVRQTSFIKIGKKWYYADKKTGKFVKGWKKISGQWYYFDKKTMVKATGWKTIKGKKCYFDSKGILKIGKHG